MKRNRILYTGFKKAHARNVSCSLLLLEQLSGNRYFLFSNDYDDIAKAVEVILEEKWDKIIMFGQKPMVKGLRVERCAKNGEEVLITNIDEDKMDKVLRENDIDFKWSENPGNYYCNYAYFEMLKAVKTKNLKTEVVFIHIPYVDNFVQMDEFVNLLNNDETF